MRVLPFLCFRCIFAPEKLLHGFLSIHVLSVIQYHTWPNHTPLEKKLYGTTEELALTVDYIVASGLTVWQTAAGRTKKKKKKYHTRNFDFIVVRKYRKVWINLCQRTWPYHTQVAVDTCLDWYKSHPTISPEPHHSVVCISTINTRLPISKFVKHSNSGDL